MSQNQFCSTQQMCFVYFSLVTAKCNKQNFVRWQLWVESQCRRGIKLFCFSFGCFSRKLIMCTFGEEKVQSISFLFPKECCLKWLKSTNFTNHHQRKGLFDTVQRAQLGLYSYDFEYEKSRLNRDGWVNYEHMTKLRTLAKTCYTTFMFVNSLSLCQHTYKYSPHLQKYEDVHSRFGLELHTACAYSYCFVNTTTRDMCW